MRSVSPTKALLAVMTLGLGLSVWAELTAPQAPAAHLARAMGRLAIPFEDVTGAIPAAETDKGRALHAALADVGLAVFASGAGLLVLLTWHNRKLRRERDRAEALARALERAHSDISAANAELTARNASLDRRDRELGLQNRRFDAALNNMSQALCMVDGQERLVVFNRRFGDLFGVDVAPIPGLSLEELRGLAKTSLLGETLSRQAAALPLGGAAAFSFEAADGRVLEASVQAMAGGGWVATYEDVSQRRAVDARLTFLAHHDVQTGLLNRQSFAARVASVLEGRRDRMVAVHIVDVDGLTEINDSFGQPFGDALLREVARRLGAAAGPRDAVARLGGDEFAILRPDATERDGEQHFAEQLAGRLAERFSYEGLGAEITASLGVVVHGAEETGANAILAQAQAALAEAKRAGRGEVCVFEPTAEAERQARRALERDLKGALGRGEIELFFQPLVDARRGTLAGYETLARWRHPDRGLVPPALFIPMAEEAGLIVDLGAHVLREACRRAASWPEGLVVAVNLSPAQVAAPGLVAAVEEALGRAGLDPTRLEIEVTENLPLGDDALAVLHAIRHLGVRISMDDFGTGYASLSYLRRFPFDKIKIDQSFVRDLPSRPECAKIVGAMTTLARNLGMTIIAEGVETAEAFAMLKAAGCDQVQGFHFGCPEAAEALTFAVPAPPAFQIAAE